MESLSTNGKRRCVTGLQTTTACWVVLATRLHATCGRCQGVNLGVVFAPPCLSEQSWEGCRFSDPMVAPPLTALIVCKDLSPGVLECRLVAWGRGGTFVVFQMPPVVAWLVGFFASQTFVTSTLVAVGESLEMFRSSFTLLLLKTFHCVHTSHCVCVCVCVCACVRACALVSL